MGWRMQQGYQCREMMMSVGRKVERVFPSPIPLVILAPPIPLVILALPIPLVILAHPTMVILAPPILLVIPAHPIFMVIRAPTTFSPTPSQLLKHPLEPTPQSQQKGKFSARHKPNKHAHSTLHACRPMHRHVKASFVQIYQHTYICLITTLHTHTMHRQCTMHSQCSMHSQCLMHRQLSMHSQCNMHRRMHRHMHRHLPLHPTLRQHADAS